MLAAVCAAQPRSPLALETSEGFPRDAVVIIAAFESPLSFTTLSSPITPEHAKVFGMTLLFPAAVNRLLLSFPGFGFFVLFCFS